MINITTVQQVNLTIVPEDILGHVVPNSDISGIPLWSSSNVGIASLVVSADGFSAQAFGTGPGTASINIIANAGTTVSSPVQISGSVLIGVSQAPAGQLIVNASVPVTQ